MSLFSFMHISRSSKYKTVHQQPIFKSRIVVTQYKFYKQRFSTNSKHSVDINSILEENEENIFDEIFHKLEKTLSIRGDKKITVIKSSNKTWSIPELEKTVLKFPQTTTTTSWNECIKKYIRESNLDYAKKVFFRMQQDSIQRDEATYRYILEPLCLANDQTALTIFKDMLSNNIPISEPILYSILRLSFLSEPHNLDLTGMLDALKLSGHDISLKTCYLLTAIALKQLPSTKHSVDWLWKKIEETWNITPDIKMVLIVISRMIGEYNLWKPALDYLDECTKNYKLGFSVELPQTIIELYLLSPPVQDPELNKLAESISLQVGSIPAQASYRSMWNGWWLFLTKLREKLDLGNDGPSLDIDIVEEIFSDKPA